VLHGQLSAGVAQVYHKLIRNHARRGFPGADLSRALLDDNDSVWQYVHGLGPLLIVRLNTIRAS
jgi:hypothetical protein